MTYFNCPFSISKDYTITRQLLYRVLCQSSGSASTAGTNEEKFDGVKVRDRILT